ncbi:MAG: phage tail tape measure protein, partial [Pseudomonadota bacterium]
AGAMLKEFEAQADTTQAQLRITMNTINQISTVIGTVFLPAVNDALETVRDFIIPLTAWAEANPQLVTDIGKVVAVLAGLKVAVFAARVAFVGLFGPLAKIVAFVGRVTLVVARLNPFWLLATAVVGLGLLIHKHWDGIVGYFTEKIEAVRAAFDVGFLQGILAIFEQFNPVTLLVDALSGLVSAATEEIGHVLSAIDGALSGFSLYDSGKAMIQTLWDGAKGIIPNMVAAIQAHLAALVPDWLMNAWTRVAGGPVAEAAAALPPASDVIAQTPPRVAQAGPVTQTTNVGDIHVTVAQTNASPADIGQAVADQVALRTRRVSGQSFADPMEGVSVP